MTKFDFGQGLADSLSNCHVTQAELARRIGVKAHTVSEWVNNHTQPRLQTVCNIMEALGISFEELRGGNQYRERVEMNTELYI